MRKYIFAAALIVSMSAQATETQVFGFPIGGKLGYEIRACKGTKLEARMCWVSSPSKLQGGARMGHVLLPDGNLPEWAINNFTAVSIEKDGMLREIKMELFRARPKDALEISSSISQRFGLPTGHIATGNIVSWTWRLKDITIEYYCNINENCYLRFGSTYIAEDDKRRIEAQRAKDAARPKTP